MYLLQVLLAVGLAAGAAATQRLECSTNAYGAQPSRTEYQTAALQAAIDACSSSCGTVIVDTPGAYLTASLLLTGCVHLRLPANVTLLAGDRRADYGTGQADWYLLHFHNCTGCSLSGGGRVDGQARRWVLPEGKQQGAALASTGRKAVRNWDDPSCAKPEECRPRLVGVVASSDVHIRGVRLRDPVYWCLHVLRSQGVHISGVSIRGDWDIPNNDGIDIDGSWHVSVRDAEVDTADDAICLKTTTPGWPLENVTVSDCRLRSRSSAVKLGSESAADMRRIRFARLSIADSHRALAIQLRDGGTISDVRFTNVSASTRLYHPSWWGAAEPIYVTALPRNGSVQVGSVRNVTFSDIKAISENGIFVAGGPLPLPHGGGQSAAGGTGCANNAGGPPGVHAARRSGPAQQEQQQQGAHKRQFSISGLTIQRVQLQLVGRSKWPGGCQDYRPSSNSSATARASTGGRQWRGDDRGSSSSSSSSSSSVALSKAWWPAGLDCSRGWTAPLWVAGAEHVLLSDVQIKHHQPWREDWSWSAHVDNSSTADVQLRRVRISSDATGVAQLLQGLRLLLGGMRPPAVPSGGWAVAWAVWVAAAAVGSAALAIAARL